MKRTLLDIGSDGQRLRVVATDDLRPLGGDPLFSGLIEVEAHPFTGVIATTLTDKDVSECTQAVDALAASGSATIGGGRAPLIELEIEGSVTEVRVTVSGDDPWPSIRYLIFPK